MTEPILSSLDFEDARDEIKEKDSEIMLLMGQLKSLNDHIVKLTKETASSPSTTLALSMVLTKPIARRFGDTNQSFAIPFGREKLTP